jgi:hypothetical protein
MEKWEIRNRTNGAVEIGCVRKEALQAGARYVFEGSCPEPLRWLLGARKIYLTQVVGSAAVEKPAPVRPSELKSKRKTESKPSEQAPPQE